MTQLSLADWVDEAPAAQRERRRSIAERFADWHAAHPEVYRKLVTLARQAKAMGMSRYGMKALWEVARWSLYVDSEGQEYKLNNDFTAPMARLIMAQEPDLDGFFETRERRSA